MSDALHDLELLLDAASEHLPRVAPKQMFGCRALFADGTIFALVWKTGRVAVKLTVESDYAQLMRQPGAAPWTAGTMKMSGWVMVPSAWHDDEAKLKPWVDKAHAQALSAPKRAAKKKAKKTPARR